MDDVDRLRILLGHWIEHNSEHAEEFRRWAERVAPAREGLITAARLVEQASAQLQATLEQLSIPLAAQFEGTGHS
jgi:N-acetylglucosamine kinase-like BadF-type ATPase